jgi:hypothetical protein
MFKKFLYLQYTKNRLIRQLQNYKFALATKFKLKLWGKSSKNKVFKPFYEHFVAE